MINVTLLEELTQHPDDRLTFNRTNETGMAITWHHGELGSGGPVLCLVAQDSPAAVERVLEDLRDFAARNRPS